MKSYLVYDQFKNNYLFPKDEEENPLSGADLKINIKLIQTFEQTWHKLSHK